MKVVKLFTRRRRILLLHPSISHSTHVDPLKGSFLNIRQSRSIFVYFRPFPIPITISIIRIEKSVDGVLGIRTQGCSMVGAY